MRPKTVDYEKLKADMEKFGVKEAAKMNNCTLTNAYKIRGRKRVAKKPREPRKALGWEEIQSFIKERGDSYQASFRTYNTTF